MDTEAPPKRAVIYTRVSLDRDGDKLAVTRQEEACRREAERRGWTVARVFTDNSLSASSFATKTRDSYEEMLKGVSDGLFDGVIAYQLDRVTRRVDELEHLIKLVDETKVKVTTVQGDLDLTTPAGRIMATVIAAFARGEVENKSLRQKLANEQRAKSGRHHGRAIPFGYLRDGKTLVKDPEVESHVNHIFELVMGGGSARDAMEYLVAQGIPTQSQRYAVALEARVKAEALEAGKGPLEAESEAKEASKGKGKAWIVESAYQILVNPVYAGVLRYKGEIVDAKTSWEPYLDLEQHELVKAQLTALNTNPGSDHRKAPKAEFPLSGILKCACGGHMTGRTRVKGVRAYMCSRRRAARGQGKCFREMRAVQAEEAVRSYVLGRLNGLAPESLVDRGSLDRQRQIAQERMRLAKERSEIEADMSVDRKTRRSQVAEVIEEDRALLEELADMTQESVLGRIVAQVLGWGRSHVTFEEASASEAAVAEAFDALGRSQRRELVDALGVYTVRPGGGTRPSKLAIYPKEPVKPGDPLNLWQVSPYSTDEDPWAHGSLNLSPYWSPAGLPAVEVRESSAYPQDLPTSNAVGLELLKEMGLEP